VFGDADVTGATCVAPAFGELTVANKYAKQVCESLGDAGRGPILVDVYDVLAAFQVSFPAAQHAVKKLLCPGQRGVKDAMQDLSEARSSIDRAMQLLEARKTITQPRDAK
jgi:hypothetical protein